ncbi:hypothetical protein OWR29_35030 [Actinoplanes sp. Pm04-4]|uniref:Uncharacterized protein n=1 Tax=Paractinoplanes pyxinae TaxID=2997416 RepID=A0ABT4B9R0_9ACTN|nr:hypothetical protein [Actinoplanes pyxinae]MCY1143238.1 hypothetical protein [Actinoplanes pyxinae]
MTSEIQMAGFIFLGLMVLAVVVLGTISWARNRNRPRPADQGSGGSGAPDSTPGDWDGGAHGEA